MTPPESTHVTSVAGERWQREWLIAGPALIWVIGLNAFVWWIELSSAVDSESIRLAEPAFGSVIDFFGIPFTAMTLGLAVAVVIGAVVVSRDRSNRIGWILVGTACTWLLASSLGVAAMLSVAEFVPRSWAPWLTALSAAFYFAFFTGGFLLLALFPSGTLPAGVSAAVRFAFAVWGAIALARTLHPGPPFTPLARAELSFDNPFGWEALRPMNPRAFVVAVGVMGALAVVVLLGRYRASDPEAKQQIKWVVLAFVFLMTGGIVMEISPDMDGVLLVAGANVVTWVALAVAITKYRLYDIDLIINRAFVYASMAVFIGGVYVSVVVGVGSLLGSTEEPDAVLSIGATALVAVGFQPVRRRLELVANRLVFGRRATPYEVLSEFSRRVAATSADLLGDAARSLAEGTRADRVVVSVVVGGVTVEAAAWPVVAGDSPVRTVSFPIEDGDSLLGSLDVLVAEGQEWREDDRRLAEQLASGMGLALRNQLLTERLEARVEELRESRRRLVAVQDETRRRLERDLHDGAQQQLVALKVKLGLGRAIAEKDGATKTAELLGRLSGEADEAVDAMREFARGVYPPLLEAEGLASAVAAHARRSPIPVSVKSDDVGRYPREIESTVYFCVLEALRNTVQHANASQATVSLTQSNGSLVFQVSDDGYGFDSNIDRGVGLRAMADRLDALTGELAVHTEAGNGTTITGVIPVQMMVPA